MKKTALLTLLFLAANLLSAQGKSVDQQLFESLHGHASFNAVFVVLAIILVGLLFFLWRTDRKVAKLEKEIQNKQS
jgi:CcmD family protein